MSIMSEIGVFIINEITVSAVGVPVILTVGEVGGFFLTTSTETADGWADGDPQFDPNRMGKKYHRDESGNWWWNNGYKFDDNQSNQRGQHQLTF